MRWGRLDLRLGEDSPTRDPMTFGTPQSVLGSLG
jgi:hypothetical protein